MAAVSPTGPSIQDYARLNKQAGRHRVRYGHFSSMELQQAASTLSLQAQHCISELLKPQQRAYVLRSVAAGVPDVPSKWVDVVLRSFVAKNEEAAMLYPEYSASPLI